MAELNTNKLVTEIKSKRYKTLRDIAIYLSKFELLRDKAIFDNDTFSSGELKTPISNCEKIITKQLIAIDDIFIDKLLDENPILVAAGDTEGLINKANSTLNTAWLKEVKRDTEMYRTAHAELFEDKHTEDIPESVSTVIAENPVKAESLKVEIEKARYDLLVSVQECVNNIIELDTQFENLDFFRYKPAFNIYYKTLVDFINLNLKTIDANIIANAISGNQEAYMQDNLRAVAVNVSEELKEAVKQIVNSNAKFISNVKSNNIATVSEKINKKVEKVELSDVEQFLIAIQICNEMGKQAKQSGKAVYTGENIEMPDAWSSDKFRFLSDKLQLRVEAYLHDCRRLGMLEENPDKKASEAVELYNKYHGTLPSPESYLA